MTWFYFSIGAAIFLSTSDAFSKSALKVSDIYTVAWIRWALASPLLLSALLFIDIPELDGTFFIVTFAALPLEVAAILLYMKAISISPLSLTIPFLAFTPLFLLLTSYLILGERTDGSGAAGIIAITMGAYLLNVRSMTKGGITAPLKMILREKGSVLMIVVAFIYSITSNLGKIAVIHSSPLFFAAFYNFFLALLLMPFALRKGREGLHAVRRKPFLFSAIGLFYGLMLICHFSAIALVEVPYMIAVKRTSMIFSVFYGAMFFGEKGIAERAAGSLLMLAGVALIMI